MLYKQQKALQKTAHLQTTDCFYVVSIDVESTRGKCFYSREIASEITHQALHEHFRFLEFDIFNRVSKMGLFGI